MLVLFIHLSGIFPANRRAPAVVNICALLGPVCRPKVLLNKELPIVETVQFSGKNDGDLKL